MNLMLRITQTNSQQEGFLVLSLRCTQGEHIYKGGDLYGYSSVETVWRRA
jgi:hypothetical protein